MPHELSSTSSTSHTPAGGRESEPEKSTSWPEGARSWAGACVAIAHCSASATFDLPLPLGPTITAMPWWNVSSTLPGNDLKPRMRMLLRYMRLGRAPGRCLPAPRGRRPARRPSCWAPSPSELDAAPTSAAVVNRRWCGGPEVSVSSYVTDAPRRASSSCSTVLWSTCAGARSRCARRTARRRPRRSRRSRSRTNTAPMTASTRGGHDALRTRSRVSISLGAQPAALRRPGRGRARSPGPRPRSWRARRPGPAPSPGHPSTCSGKRS